jgi:hypothetical protein
MSIELNNIEQIKEIQGYFKDIENHLSRSFLGACFLIYHISHRKAINRLSKKGFINCGNPLYMQKGNIIVYKKSVSYPEYTLCRISLNDYDILKQEGFKEVLNEGARNQTEQILNTIGA